MHFAINLILRGVVLVYALTIVFHIVYDRHNVLEYISELWHNDQEPRAILEVWVYVCNAIAILYAFSGAYKIIMMLTETAESL